MTATYYTVVWRPKGSKTWTPWHGNKSDQHIWWHFYRNQAQNTVKWLRTLGITHFLHGDQKEVPIEFRVAKVTV